MGEPEGAGGFSSYLLGHRLLYYFHRNADNILIGRYLGATALGAYALAYNIMLVPFTRIAGPVQRVLGPAFARMQDEPRRIADAWVRAVRLVGALAIPSLLGLMVVAPDFVSVVLGDQWAAAVPLIQVLAIVGIVQSLQSISTDILQARGQANTIFRFSVLFTVTHTAGFVVGLGGASWAWPRPTPSPASWWSRSTPSSPRVRSGSRPGSWCAGCGHLRGQRADDCGRCSRRLGLVELGACRPGPARRLRRAGAGLCVLAASAWRAPEARSDLRGILHDALGARLARLRARRMAGVASGGPA